jgi:hypothetical protein
MIEGMEATHVDEAVELLEKANANLEPELLSAHAARDLLAAYARAEKLSAYGKTMLARKVDDATETARVTGTSVAKAKATVDNGKALSEADEVRSAFQSGAISSDQAAEIARAEQAHPGSASELLEVAARDSFQVLREKARKVVLEAEQRRGLAARQHAARSARTYNDELGMVHLHLAWEPHVGTPIVNRAEAEAARRYRGAKKDGRTEPFERHLADAYASMLAGAPTTRSRRPELVVLVSHEVTQRGWTEVKEGELCKIPGVGPVAPEVAQAIAADAFLTGVLFDGSDLRQLRRWTRNIPVEVFTALQLGQPPEFDGVKCVDCGKRFRPEKDHLEPHNAFGPASTDNLEWRCHSCHSAKTERDRKAGKLRPRRSGDKPRAGGPKTRLAARTPKVEVGTSRYEAERGPPS